MYMHTHKYTTIYSVSNNVLGEMRKMIMALNFTLPLTRFMLRTLYICKVGIICLLPQWVYMEIIYLLLDNILQKIFRTISLVSHSVTRYQENHKNNVLLIPSKILLHRKSHDFS